MPGITLAYVDLDYYLSGVTIQAVNDLVTRIAGEGSLRVDRVSGTDSPSMNCAPKTTAGVRQGLTTGIIRGTFQVETLSSSSPACGLLCMQSQRNVTVAGACYALAWQPLKTSAQLTLRKYSAGLAVPGSTVAVANAPAGTTLALQLAWALAPNGAQLVLEAAAGTALDYGDLSPLLSYTDTSPLTATVTEGAFYEDGGAGQDFSMLLDNLSLMER